jgi:hypothetical protein
MNRVRPLALASWAAVSALFATNPTFAAERWQESMFPPPNGGRLVFAITPDGNPECASYDGRNCLWGKSVREIDFTKVKPLACGARHRELYGVTGFEDPAHWCNLALRAAQKPGAPQSGGNQPPPSKPSNSAGGYRTTDWSGWGRAEGVQYRYRVGWDPAKGNANTSVDVIYEIRNTGTQKWPGSARSLDCTQKTLMDSKPVTIEPGQTMEVRVRAPNCGSATNPDVRPSVVRSKTL